MREILSIAKALSDESRLRALIAVKDGELCLCQIIQVLGLSPATVSKHMNTLEQARLVERTRRGKWRYYKLADSSGSRAVKQLLAWVLNELRDDPQLSEDARKIRKVRRQDLVELSACYRS
jgi:ArsR family transcriptional regulator, arsenate/arsenite/antimonite-responsive transcriptional repressor